MISAAIDTAKLADAWQALHPREVSAAKAINPVLDAFLTAARDAIVRALRSVLPSLWTEGYVLGQVAAEAVVTKVSVADWQGWTPGDAEAAGQIAGAGLRQLLAEENIRIQSIADTRVEELADVLEETLASDEITRVMDEPKPVVLSVGDLARRLKDVLDRPRNAHLVAQAEIGRAQAEAARHVYAANGVAEVEISTAEDARVCPVCDAAAAVGPHPLGTAPRVLLHPRCRCAELPVLDLAGAA